MESRKYQLREDIPLVIFCAEDHHSNIKGLSFRSGACRKDKERFGVIMLTWRDDGSLAADVLEHELGHLIGGVHTQKNGTETHVGHTDFNSENINTWFSLAGDRCYGKNCSSPPAMPHGSWICDSELQSCDLKCDWGFTTVSSTIIQCQNGKWSQNIHDMACFPSVFLVAGGDGARKDVEIFHPEVGNLNCTNKPPALTLEWERHTTFSHRGKVYICGGYYTKGLCISYNNGWSTHSLHQHRLAGHSSVVIGETIFLIGGFSNPGLKAGVVQSRLPLLTDTPTWSPVPNMPYKGYGQCSVKVDIKSFLVIGGEKDGVSLNTVSKYNVVEETTEALAPLIQSRGDHGCLVLRQNGTTWIIVTGGYSGGLYLKSTEILNLSDSRNKWMSIGDLNEARDSHGMALTVKGPIVVAGGDNQSIEVLNWQTKLWTKFEQSLTTARARFGGVIELPSNLFHCELNIETGCPDIPAKENGIFHCDSTKTSCSLTCHPGFSSSYTTTTCTGGVWKEINNMECTESIFIVAGGLGAERNVEIFHPEVPNIKCSSPPPPLDLEWYRHTSFTYQGRIYLCGGGDTKGYCTTYSYNDNSWSLHSLQEDRQYDHSSVVVGDMLFFIGGKGSNGYYGVEQSRLPFLTDTPTWSPVLNMTYKGLAQCSVKTGVKSFVVTGGFKDGALRKVTRYNIEDETTEALAPLIHPRIRHGCLVKEENGETWIIVTGGSNKDGYPKSTEILNLSNSGNVWISSGDLNGARLGHGMALTVKGPIIVGGRDIKHNAPITDIIEYNELKSIEVLNWQTKIWTQFEQSLTTARSLYGGVIELPGYLFGCETQPIKITGCTGEYKYNEELIGGGATQVGQDETCHSVCQKDDDCLGWTWTQQKQCRIINQQSALDSLQSKNGSISGVKNACKPKCYLVLSENEEASTNTQFCTDENTDCLNMIHLEPDDFQPSDNGSIKICHHDEVRGESYCEDVDYENIALFCNPDPGIVTLSTFQRINKYRFYGHLKPYFKHWGK